MAEVLEINDIETLQGIRMAWQEMLPATSGATFFQTSQWLALYWQHFGKNQKLRVLVVQASGKPIGIVPLCIREERFRVGTLRVLTYPLHDWGTWFGPLGSNPAATMFMAMQHLRKTPADWDLLELRWTDAARSDRGRTSRAMLAAGFRAEKAVYDTTAAVDLAAGKEAYWRGRTSQCRNNVSRCEKRLTAQGRWEILRHRPRSLAEGDGDPRWDLYQQCCEVAARSWQGKHPSGTTLASPAVAPFLQDAHAAAARLGMVDMNLLKLDGKPIAFAYNYHHGGRIQGLRAGYDAQYERTGAGTVLLWRTLQDSFDRNDTWYDLGTGGQVYKRRLATHWATSHRFTHYRPLALRCQGVRLTRWLKNRVAGRKAAAVKLAPDAKAVG